MKNIATTCMNLHQIITSIDSVSSIGTLSLPWDVGRADTLFRQLSKDG